LHALLQDTASNITKLIISNIYTL